MFKIGLCKIIMIALFFSISSTLFAATGLSYVNAYLDSIYSFSSSLLPSSSKPTSSFLDQNGHIIQLRSISQSHYEHSTAQDLQKPPILDGEQGLCGLLATYNACCLLQACDDPDKTKEHIANLTSIDAFHKWIEDNLDAIEAIKKERGKIGSATDLSTKRWARSALKEQYYDENDEENSEEKHNQSNYPRFSMINYKNISNSKDDADYQHIHFSNCFQRSTKAYAVIFSVNYSWTPENHGIAVVFNHSTTWVIDSNNIPWVKNKQIIALDRFMREKSTPGLLSPITSLPGKAYNLYQTLKCMVSS